MQHQYTCKTFFTSIVIGVLLAGNCSQVWADDVDKVEPLELRKIMQELNKNMQGVTDSISREDWGMVGEIAPLIADHPQPPLLEKMRILMFAGTDVGKFKEYDKTTHQAARTLEQAADSGDGKSVISAFAALQNSCLDCHQSFRKAFVEHFYD